tara:strand:+ start:1729 stop:2658 length:930 start_codon:yes stop_codon:yes gene_type:complete
MNKYKLIKEYPGSPKLWDIAVYKYEPCMCANAWQTKSQMIHSDITLSPEFWKEIIEYPVGTQMFNTEAKTGLVKKEDGWYKFMTKTAYTDEMVKSHKNIVPYVEEEVIEKDYKILSFINKAVKIVLREDGFYHYSNVKGNHSSLDEKKALSRDYWGIHSVKRLSDGKIFTVGDIIDRNPDYKRDTIRGFTLYENRILVSLSDAIDIGYSSGKGCNMSIISHSKPILFVTEDKVKIYKDTASFVVNKKLEISGPLMFNGKSENFKYFSTLKAAKEYVIHNTPCLSLNEIYSLYPTAKGVLEKIVKNKLCK